MRTLLRWAAQLYPARWRNRYADEFDALLDDAYPTFGDLWDVLGDVVRVRMTSPMDACLMTAPVSPMTSRLPVIASLSAHGLMMSLVLLAIWGQVTTMPLRVVAPLPPPVPEPPPEVTDARVFPSAPSLYSSLPLKMPAPGDALRLYVADGVGIEFLPLPDIGAEYRQGNAEWRVCQEHLLWRRRVHQQSESAEARDDRRGNHRRWRASRARPSDH